MFMGICYGANICMACHTDNFDVFSNSPMPHTRFRFSPDAAIFSPNSRHADVAVNSLDIPGLFRCFFCGLWYLSVSFDEFSFHNTIRPANMSKRTVDDMHNRDIADATGPQRQETTTKVARLESNNTTTACAYDKCKEKCKQSLEAKVSPVSDKHSEVLPVTLTKQQQEDTTLLAGLEKYPAFCMCTSVETNARLAVLIAARPLESRGLCAGGCGHDVLVTQYRDKGRIMRRS